MNTRLSSALPYASTVMIMLLVPGWNAMYSGEHGFETGRQSPA